MRLERDEDAKQDHEAASPRDLRVSSCAPGRRAIPGDERIGPLSVQRAGPVATYDAVARAALNDVSALKAAGASSPIWSMRTRQSRSGVRQSRLLRGKGREPGVHRIYRAVTS
jgi:hypothetical protein